MGIVRFGKARESTNWSSELYKDRIRGYLESIGYSQTTDSFVEGHSIDMVFEPAWGQSKRRVWVEAKNHELSLKDQRFEEELVGYLTRWLQLPAERRFELKIFIKKMVNEREWRRIFDADDEDQILAWIRDLRSRHPTASLPDPERRREDFLNFLSMCEINEGDIQALEEAALVKKRTSAFEIGRTADRQREEMNERAADLGLPDTLKANLVSVEIPSTFRLLETKTVSKDEILGKLKGESTPPYSIIGEGKLLTLDLDDIDSVFDVLNVVGARSISSSMAEETYPVGLVDLLNRCFRRIAIYKGAISMRELFFFPPKKSTAGTLRRTVPSESRTRVTVATPKYSYETIDGFRGTKRLIHHVFHYGFSLRAKRFGENHYACIGLKKLYSRDGFELFESEIAKKLDYKYRKSAYYRSETQLRLTSALAHYLFRHEHWEKGKPEWYDQFKFGRLVESRIDWSPKQGHSGGRMDLEPSRQGGTLDA